jgi:hypothetical protein
LTESVRVESNCRPAVRVSPRQVRCSPASVRVSPQQVALVDVDQSQIRVRGQTTLIYFFSPPSFRTAQQLRHIDLRLNCSATKSKTTSLQPTPQTASLLQLQRHNIENTQKYKQGAPLHSFVLCFRVFSTTIHLTHVLSRLFTWSHTSAAHNCILTSFFHLTFNLHHRITSAFHHFTFSSCDFESFHIHSSLVAFTCITSLTIQLYCHFITPSQLVIAAYNCIATTSHHPYSLSWLAISANCTAT